MLDKNPQLAGRLYKTTSLAKVDKRLKNNPNDLEALILNVESLTTYAFGFLIEESDRMMLENYSKAKNLELQAHDYFAEAVQYGDSAFKYLNYNIGDFPVAEKQAKNILTLPIHQNLKKKEIIYICKLINKFYEQH